MFNEDHKAYLDSHREYYTKLKESGSLTRISSVVVKGFQTLYKEAIGGQRFNLWCSSCVIELIELCYLNYDKFLEDERRNEILAAATVTRHEPASVKPEISKPESKGKILQKPGRTAKKSR